MRLISYTYAERDRYGALTEGGIVDLSARVGRRWPSLRLALAGGALGALADEAAVADPDHDPDEVQFLLPISDPQKILCVGRNYRDYHEVIADAAEPSYPSIFARFPSSFAPHRQSILKPRAGEQLDYEGELVAVIGKTARHVAAAEALDCVAGYTCMNEGTLRDWRNRGRQNTPAKNFLRSGGVGPWVTTADEIGDPSALRITTRRNGDVVQDGGTDLMIFDLPFLIAYMSSFTILEPGDLIATGSPSGSIIGTESPRWLQAGETVEVEVSRVGTLSNTVEAE